MRAFSSRMRCCSGQAGCFFFEQGLGTMVDNDVWENQVLPRSLSKFRVVFSTHKSRGRVMSCLPD